MEEKGNAVGFLQKWQGYIIGAIGVLITLGTIIQTVSNHTDKIEKVEDKIEKVENKIEKVEKELKSVREDIDEVKDDVNEIKGDIRYLLGFFDGRYKHDKRVNQTKEVFTNEEKKVANNINAKKLIDDVWDDILIRITKRIDEQSSLDDVKRICFDVGSDYTKFIKKGQIDSKGYPNDLIGDVFGILVRDRFVDEHFKK